MLGEQEKIIRFETFRETMRVLNKITKAERPMCISIQKPCIQDIAPKTIKNAYRHQYIKQHHTNLRVSKLVDN